MELRSFSHPAPVWGCAPSGAIVPAAFPFSFLGGCWCIGASSSGCSGPGKLNELDAQCSAAPACVFIPASSDHLVGVRMKRIGGCSVLALLSRRSVSDVGDGGQRCFAQGL